MTDVPLWDWRNERSELMELKSMSGGVGHLKASFLGWGGSGKTFTAMRLAVGTRKHFGLKGPIAMLDTEGGAQYLADYVKSETGTDLIGVQSRALSDALTFIDQCVKDGISVAIIDSASHLWLELLKSYLDQVNEHLAKHGKNPRKLEFQDWGNIKRQWAKLTDAYLNSPLHLIVNGRAGDKYVNEVNDEGKREIVNVGIKMVAEGQFGYEPSLLVEMEQIQFKRANEPRAILRRATVLKDRFGIIDGKWCDNPTFDFFKPFIEKLKSGSHVKVDTATKTQVEVDDSGDAEWQREKKRRAIFCEEVQGLLLAEFPGQTAEEKRAKSELIFQAFETRSWTAVENMTAERIKAGLDKLPVLIGTYKMAQKITSEPAPAVAEEPKKNGNKKAATAGKDSK